MAEVVTIYWRDIPAQVIVKQGRSKHKVQLSPRFQTAIDRAAERAGKESADDYLAEWRRVSVRSDATDLIVAAEAEAERLQAQFPREILERYVAGGGTAPNQQQPGDTP